MSEAAGSASAEPSTDVAPEPEVSPTPAAPAVPVATAGGLLRDARQARGLHIAALATAIKVAPRKLELLEGDRFDELPDATFTRALAQTVCRTLKIDAAPVLALLPQAGEKVLESMNLGLNAPFRDRPGRREPSDLQFLKSPIVLGAVALLIAAAAVYLLPAGWLNEKLGDRWPSSAATPSGDANLPVMPPPSPSSPLLASETVITPAEVQSPVAASASATAMPVATVAAAASAAVPSPAATPSEPAVSQAAPARATSGALLLRASAESWVEVIDGRGISLMARALQPGETVGLDGASPLQVRIGNATATTVSFRGRPVELKPSRDNVAKLELK